MNTPRAARWVLVGLASVAGLVMSPSACSTDANPPVKDSKPRISRMPTVKYLEIVTHDVDSACKLYADLYGATFGPEDESLGKARTATRPDGALIGVRRPLASHEQPLIRTYVAVADIGAAVEVAERRGATVAYPPTEQGEHGSFAIVIQDGLEHGLWQP